MAWNRSTKDVGGITPPPKKKLRGVVLAGVAAMVAIGLVVFIFTGDSKEAPQVQGKPAAKAEVAKGPAKDAPKSETKPVEVTVDPDARPTKVGEVVNGYVMLPSGRIHRPTGVVTNRVAEYAKSKYSIFEHRSDNEIASILMMNPGDTIVGNKNYGRWFARKFLESLDTPIEVDPEDEPWRRDLKHSVIAARKELKDAYDRGEDIAGIMAESREQLQSLARYKQQVRQMYAKELKECKTEQDLKDLQDAVNAMLESQGCAAMDFTPLTKRNLTMGKE